MSTRWLLLWYAVVVFVTFLQNEILDQPNFLEPSLILIVIMARTTAVRRALIATFIISVSLDLLFSVSQVKGLAAMVQLLLVYGLSLFQKHIVPRYWDVFVLVYFAIFYLLNYYGSWGLSELLGLRFDALLVTELVYRAVIHTLIFGAVLLMLLRFSKDLP